MAARRAPQRTCVACRRVRPKRELTRVVRSVEGAVEVDPSGKKSGRGAYLCRARACWDTALRKQVLSKALKIELRPADLEQLSQFSESFPVETNE
jgi:predicted RNA-binding protein YlxR (DUF448 family)